jgi:HEAT repeat protein
VPQTPAADSEAGSISPVVSIEPEPEATASASPKQTEESTESLIAKLDDKNDLLVRYKAIEKLGQIGGDQAVEALLGSMKDAQFEYVTVLWRLLSK